MRVYLDFWEYAALTVAGTITGRVLCALVAMAWRRRQRRRTDDREYDDTIRDAWRGR